MRYWAGSSSWISSKSSGAEETIAPAHEQSSWQVISSMSTPSAHSQSRAQQSSSSAQRPENEHGSPAEKSPPSRT